jgi:hypothetical protein
MKKTTLYLLFFITLIKTNAQDFAPIGAEWYYSEGFAFTGDQNYLYIVSEKDTTFQGKNCRKLVKEGNLSCSGRPQTEYIYFENNEVYFWTYGIDEFQKLYDFNASKDTSWKVRINDFEGSYDTININIDSITLDVINGKELKVQYVTYTVSDYKWDFNYSYQSKIIETIGDMTYLFNLYPLIVCDVNYSAGLRCYQDSELGFYTTGIADSCDYVYDWTSIESAKSDFEINVMPNPTNGIINIEIANKDFLDIELRDLSGRLFYQGNIKSKTSIDLSDFQNGLYILLIRDKDLVCGYKRVLKE